MQSRFVGSLLMCVLLLLAANAALASLKPAGPRKVLSLDGTWQVEQGAMDAAPRQFTHSIVVPGLLDMAQPAFTEIGKKSPQRQAFWYRRTFKVDGPVPDVAILKIHKARYGTKVWLDGQVVGEHLPCFTPAYLNVKPFVKGDGQDNELIIRIGADRESVPAGQPAGWDFEKHLFIPGIYDSVELILTGTPYIQNIQIAPDIARQTIQVVAEIDPGQKKEVALSMRAVEPGTADRPARVVYEYDFPGRARPEGFPVKHAADIGPLPRLWSPDDPFLYELTVSTGGDAVKVRFGMRSFTFDPKTRRALLNGKPFYIRGTNVCVYRFFEDAARGDKPWRGEWVRRLHQQFKSMHWDAIRYCIGFPPEIWYDIADETGFLIQDEFPIWLLGAGKDVPEKPVTEKIIPEYIEWMRERWNHPCVVIWDGQNESFTDQTGKAIAAVRKLDLSKRPWENGWSEPGADSDCVESHPYLFYRTWNDPKKPFRLSELVSNPGQPHLQGPQQKRPVAILINEYDWLWLTRDGNPTCLTDKVYESLLGENSTVEQRRKLHARCVAALTEFWRCHRNAAGVMHFCGLGYSRPGDKPRPEGGATSDDFTDIEKLTFEPNFFEHVREAFNPVGIMLDFWAEQAPADSQQQFGVYVINDLENDWAGDLRLIIMKGDQRVSEKTRKLKVVGLGREIVTIEQSLPAEAGDYTIIAAIADEQGKPVRSMRDVKVVK